MALLDDLFGMGAVTNPLDEIKNQLLGNMLTKMKTGEPLTNAVGTDTILNAMPKTPEPVTQGWDAVATPEPRMAQGPLQVDVGPSFAAPAPVARAPAPMAAPTPAERPDLSPSFGDRFRAFANAAAGQRVESPDKVAETRNQTYDFLVRRGVGAEDAKSLVTNPALLSAMLPRIAGASSPKWSLETVKDQFGRESRVWVNPITRETQAFNMTGTPGGSQAAPVAAPMPAPVAMPAPMAAPSPVAAPVTPVQANLGSVAPAPVAPLAAAPMGAPASEPVPAGMMTQPFPVPKAPDGMLHRQTAGGFLYRQDGSPVFENKAEADSRARVGEKRADDLRETERQSGGVRSVIADARALTNTTGFERGLELNGYGMNVPYVGQTNPIKELKRIGDRNAPEFAASDEVMAVQQRLSLLVARPLMKGQGAVTEGEREMIRQSIGDIAKAGSKADYQFRLNSVEGMIEAMNSGVKGAVAQAAGKTFRPSQRELTEITSGRDFTPERLDELAKKYNVPPTDLHEYAFRIAQQPDARQPQAAAPEAPAAAPGQPPRVGRIEEALKLKKGTVFIDPNGTRRVR